MNVFLELVPDAAELEEETVVFRELFESFFAEGVNELEGIVINVSEKLGVDAVEQIEGIVVPDAP